MAFKTGTDLFMSFSLDVSVTSMVIFSKVSLYSTVSNAYHFAKAYRWELDKRETHSGNAESYS